jgi:hypothetical protein
MNYIEKGKKRGFPDYDTFINLGFETCMVATETSQLLTIPAGEVLTMESVPYCNGTKKNLEAQRIDVYQHSQRSSDPHRGRIHRLEKVIERFRKQTIGYREFIDAFAAVTVRQR